MELIIGLSVASSTVGAISSSTTSATLLIAVNGVPWRIFSNSTVVHTKIGHVSKTTPLLGVITTYLNDNAQTPLNGFVVYMLYSQFATNRPTVTNQTDGAYHRP